MRQVKGSEIKNREQQLNLKRRAMTDSNMVDRYVNLSISSLPSLLPAQDGENNGFGADFFPRVGVVTEHKLHYVSDIDHDERARNDDQTAAPFNAQMWC